MVSLDMIKRVLLDIVLPCPSVFACRFFSLDLSVHPSISWSIAPCITQTLAGKTDSVTSFPACFLGIFNVCLLRGGKTETKSPRGQKTLGRLLVRIKLSISRSTNLPV